MPKIRKKYVQTGNLNTDDFTINPDSVVSIQNQLSNITAGSRTVIVSSTYGYVPGSTLTKTSGIGEFNPLSAILSIDGPTQFTTTHDHTVTGNITFSVGTPTSLIISGPDTDYYGINNNIGGFVDRVESPDGSVDSVIVNVPQYVHTLVNIPDPNSSDGIIIPRYDSGILNSNRSKILQRKNSLMGTLPSSSITTGKRLPILNDPFEDINIIDFKEIVSDSTFSVPLVAVKELVPGTTSDYTETNTFYITTDNNLLSNGFIKKDDYFYREKYNISNTDIFDTPNEYHTNKQSNRLVCDSNTDTLLYQNRFEEEYKPYTEDYSNFVLEDNLFHNYTIDKDKKDSYEIGEQKEIKIVIDFSNNVDLMLLNTKASFIERKFTNNTFDEGYRSDDIKDLDYFNFILGNNPKSYSSHFLPTAYFNFSKNRWNYLDGKTTIFNGGSPAHSDAYTDRDKFKFLGSRFRTGSRTEILTGHQSISSMFQFSSLLEDREEPYKGDEVYSDFIDNNFLVYMNKPIVTTPSFRNDGSFIVGNEGNKTPISKITNSYGFPYSLMWQPQKDHFLKMSDYISNDFIVEKMIVKGKITSKGEIAEKRAHVSSGYTGASGSNLDSTFSTFNSSYGCKESDKGYLSNNVTFFILNERKGINYFDKKIKTETIQSYFVGEIDDISSTNKLENIVSHSLDSYLGKYRTYYSVPDDPGFDFLQVYSHIVPSNYLYALDEYNKAVLESQYDYTVKFHAVSPDFVSSYYKLKPVLDKNLFHYFEEDSDIASIPSSTVTDRDIINFLSINTNVLDASNSLYDTRDFKTHNIRLERFGQDNNNFNDFDISRGRELVTYSNLLLLSKYSDIEIEDKILENIDEVHNISFPADRSQKINLNIDEPVSFEVKSFFKNIEKSDYTDESINKLKSNYLKSSIIAPEELSEIPLQLSPVLNEIFYKASSEDINLSEEFNSYNILFDFVNSFEQDGIRVGDDDTELKYILTGKAKEYSDLYPADYPCAIPYKHESHILNVEFKIPLPFSQVNERYVTYKINFMYSNTLFTAGGNLPPYYGSNPSLYDASLIPASASLDDFIKYTVTTSGAIDNFKVDIDINLRFLDIFYDLSVIDDFIALGRKTFTSSSSIFYNLSEITDLTKSLRLESSTLWRKIKPELSGRYYYDPDTSIKQNCLIKLIYIAFINAPVGYSDSSGGDAIFIANYDKVYNYLYFDDDPEDTSPTPDKIVEFRTDVDNGGLDRGILRFYRTNLEPFILSGYTWSDFNSYSSLHDTAYYSDYVNYFGEHTSTNSNHRRDGYIRIGKGYIDDNLDYNKNTQFVFPWISELRGQGAAAIVRETENYNIHNVLEGKNEGCPNNLGIPTERVVNVEKKSSNSLDYDIVLSDAGKILKSNGENISTSISNYILKPEDELVFGVSANSNGETIQTVITLHDKLEITLIGRDYIDTKKQKSNESLSVRKVLIGDSVIQKSSKSIYQSNDAYYDNIWNKNSILNSIEDFKTGKEVIGKKSSGEFGSYTGLITFKEEFKKIVSRDQSSRSENFSTVFKLDTAHPSLGSVYSECLRLAPMFTVDTQDIYRYFKNKKLNILSIRNNTYNIPSNKIVLSDSISKKNLERYSNRYLNIVHDWHTTFHLEKYKEYFVNENLVLSDFTYNKIGNEYNSFDTNCFVYFDINSYSAGLNYHNWIDYINKTTTTDNINYLLGGEPISSFNPSYSTKLYKSLKTYLMPMSKEFLYQNSINLDNNKDNVLGKFKNNDLIIEKNVQNRNQILLNSYSIQYMHHKIGLDYTEMTDDVLAQYYGWGNDADLIGTIVGTPETMPEVKGVQYTSGWCLVLEITKANLETILYNNLSAESLSYFESEKTIKQDNQNSNFNVHYYKNNIYLDISQDQSYSNITTKLFKLIKVIEKFNGNEIENSYLNRYILVSPLYFWETNEIDMSSRVNLPGADGFFGELNIFSLNDYIGSDPWDSVNQTGDLVHSSVSGYGRVNKPYNEEILLDTAWYAKDINLNSISNINNTNIYKDFINYDVSSSVIDSSGNITIPWQTPYIPPDQRYIRKINITGIESSEARSGISTDIGSRSGSEYLLNLHSTEKMYPYLVEELKDSTRDYYGGGLTAIDNRQIYLSFPKFNTVDDANNSPANKDSSSLYENLNNSYLFKEDLDSFCSPEYFENNLNKIRNLEYNEKINLNEKIYTSNFKIIDDENNEFEMTNELVYRIKNINNYNTLSLEGITNNFTLFKKNKIIEDELIYVDDNNFSIVTYEDLMYKNKNLTSKSLDFESDIPSFKIDLTAKLSDYNNILGFDNPLQQTNKVNVIPFCHYSIDYQDVYRDSAADDPSLNVMLQPISSYDDKKNKKCMLDWHYITRDTPVKSPIVNLGSPIYRLGESPEGFYDKNEQENKIYNFFYGFSRKGKHRYPIHRLDGFKYGVECGGKQSFVSYYKNNSYGNFSDKIMGTVNSASVYYSQGNIFNFTVEKLFVDSNNGYLYTDDNETILNNISYNKDRYARSTTPYIESATHEYSQFYVPPSS